MPELIGHSEAWQRIRDRAYFRWIAQGQPGGRELEDWCEAEQEEIRARTAGGQAEWKEAERAVLAEEEAQARGMRDRIDPALPNF